MRRRRRKRRQSPNVKQILETTFIHTTPRERAIK
jgi:hypothetical protein